MVLASISSSDSQDVKKQKLGVLDYYNTQNLNPIKFVEDMISGRIPWKERSIGKLLANGKLVKLLL